MKKIIWLVNPLSFKKSQADFPVYLAKLITGELKVIFVDAIPIDTIPVYSNNTIFPTAELTLGDVQINRERQQLIDDNRTTINDTLNELKIRNYIDPNNSLTLEEILKESVFADVLLTNISFHSSVESNNKLSSFVKEIIAKAHCPVMIAPDDKQVIEEIIFTYNGTDPSIFAIKQFTYLFDSLINIPVVVIYVQEDENGNGIPYKNLITDLLSRNYSKFSFRILKGKPETELVIELMYIKNTIITFGSDGRNKISRIFHRSESENVMNFIDIPAFITHP